MAKAATATARAVPETRETRHPLRAVRRIAPLLIFLLGGLLLLYVSRNQWFFGDEWAFLVGRDGGSFHDLIRPHNEHWSTIPIIIYRLLFNVFGVTTYIPYVATLVFLHVLLAGLVYLILRRQGSPWSMAVAAGVFVLFIGRGYENLIWAFQIGFVGSLTAALAAVLLLTSADSVRADLGASVLLMIALMSSGIGVAALGAISLTLLTRGEYGRAVRVTLVPLVAYTLWFITQRSIILGSHQPDLVESLLLLPRYVAVGFSSTFEGLLGLGEPVGIGFVVLVGAFALVWLVRQGDRRLPVEVLCPLLMAIAALSLAGLSRASVFGIDQARAPRYVHITAALLLVSLGGMFLRSRWYRTNSSIALTLLMTGLLLIATVGGMSVLRGHAWASADVRQQIKTRVLAMAAALKEAPPETVIFESRPVPHNPDISVESIERLVTHRPQSLPDLSGLPQDEIEAALARMQYLIVPDPPVPMPAGFELAELSDASLQTSSSGCISVLAGSTDPQIVLRISRAGMISVEPDIRGVVEVFAAVQSGFRQDVSATTETGPQDPVWIRVTSGLDLLRIDPPNDSMTRLCGAEA